MSQDQALALIYKGIGKIEPHTVPIPSIPGPSTRVALGACGICGSDVKYFQGHNPWALHTLGKDIPPPPDMILGHEVSGVEESTGKRVAILAFKSCGKCAMCRSGRENLCADMEHFGHSAGWPEMPYFPGGMAERFEIWEGFAYQIPDSISFEAATFLDGLAVALHALETARFESGQSIAVIGLGPIGMLLAQSAQARGARRVLASDIYEVPLRLAKSVGLEDVISRKDRSLSEVVGDTATEGLDVVFDTVGSEESITEGLSILAPGGRHVLLAVGHEPIRILPTAFSGERSVFTSANNRYPNFPEAIELLASGALSVEPLITHRFPLSEGPAAFDVMLHKVREKAYKVIIHP